MPDKEKGGFRAEGGVTVLARLLEPLLAVSAALTKLSPDWIDPDLLCRRQPALGKTIRVAKLLPAVVLAVAVSYLSPS